MASARDIYLHNLRKSCPELQLEFWGCINKAMELIDNGSYWIGRSCCSHAVNKARCQQGCYKFHN